MSNDCTGGRSGYEDVQSLPCDRDPMPRKNNQGGARPGKNRNQQMKPKPGTRTNSSQMNRSEAMGAPVSVSSDIQQYTRFSGKGGNLQMHTCAPVCQLLSNSGVSAYAGALDGGSSAARGSIQLSLTRPSSLDSAGAKQDFDYVSPVWQLLSNVFVKYRIKKCVFHYMPQSAATVSDRLVFAFAEDPAHPLVYTTAPSSSKLLALADSVAFMPWKSWSMDISHRLRDQSFYTFAYDDNALTSVNDQVIERLNDFGIIGCVTSGQTNGSPAIGGVLYMESVIEYEEFCPLTQTVSQVSDAEAALAKAGFDFTLTESAGVYTAASIENDGGPYVESTDVTAGVITLSLEAGVYKCLSYTTTGTFDNTPTVGGTATTIGTSFDTFLFEVATGETLTFTANSGTTGTLRGVIIRIADLSAVSVRRR